ncbi:MAG: hypothetical protein AB7G08_33375 [Hyphomicrobiaceae bacterium]
MMKLQDLSERSVSRRLGADAFTVLQGHLRNGAEVRIEMPSDEMVTSSFLDEFIRLLAENRQLALVTFVLRNEDDLFEKLSRIAGTRKVPLFFSNNANDERRAVAPKGFTNWDIFEEASKSDDDPFV